MGLSAFNEPETCHRLRVNCLGSGCWPYPAGNLMPASEASPVRVGTQNHSEKKSKTSWTEEGDVTLLAKEVGWKENF